MWRICLVKKAIGVSYSKMTAAGGVIKLRESQRNQIWRKWLAGEILVAEAGAIGIWRPGNRSCIWWLKSK